MAGIRQLWVQVQVPAGHLLAGCLEQCLSLSLSLSFLFCKMDLLVEAAGGSGVVINRGDPAPSTQHQHTNSYLRGLQGARGTGREGWEQGGAQLGSGVPLALPWLEDLG